MRRTAAAGCPIAVNGDLALSAAAVRNMRRRLKEGFAASHGEAFLRGCAHCASYLRIGASVPIRPILIAYAAAKIQCLEDPAQGALVLVSLSDLGEPDNEQSGVEKGPVPRSEFAL